MAATLIILVAAILAFVSNRVSLAVVVIGSALALGPAGGYCATARPAEYRGASPRSGDDVPPRPRA